MGESGRQTDAGRAPSAHDRTAARRAALLRSYLATSCGLLVQFVLGMVVNLFLKIPADHPGADSTDYFSGLVRSIAWAIPDGGLWLTLHTVVGLLLVLMSVGTLIVAVRAHTGVVTASLGLAFIVLAGFNGGSFLNYNEDFSSMIMAGLFALALGTYVVGLFRGGGPAGRAAGRPARRPMR